MGWGGWDWGGWFTYCLQFLLPATPVTSLVLCIFCLSTHSFHPTLPYTSLICCSPTSYPLISNQITHEEPACLQHTRARARCEWFNLSRAQGRRMAFDIHTTPRIWCHRSKRLVRRVEGRSRDRGEKGKR